MASNLCSPIVFDRYADGRDGRCHLLELLLQLPIESFPCDDGQFEPVKLKDLPALA